MNIIKYSKLWFTFSGILVVASLGALLTFGLPLGIDFTGGSKMDIAFENTSVTVQEIRETIESSDFDLGEVTIIEGGEQGVFIFKMKDLDEETHSKLKQSIKDKHGTFTEEAFVTIGPTIGETLKEKAFSAIIVAIVVIVLFVAYAFRKIPKRLNSWKFGVIAIIALIHDILITVGIFSVLSKYMGFEVNTLFITALLTILGYSVNDTIVIFDRIRENLKHWKKDETFADVADKSLRESIARSINTSLSTLFTLTALYILGAESIQYFVLTLIIGTVIGTYSSIFLASPLLVMWQKRKFVK